MIPNEAKSKGEEEKVNRRLRYLLLCLINVGVCGLWACNKNCYFPNIKVLLILKVLILLAFNRRPISTSKQHENPKQSSRIATIMATLL